MAEQFRLTPEEDFVYGVSHTDGALRFRGSGALLAVAVGAILVVLPLGTILITVSDFAINGHPVQRRLGVVLLGLTMIGIAVAGLVAGLRSGVTATRDFVEVREVVRRRRFGWETIHSVEAVEDVVGRWAGAAHSGGVSLRMRPVRTTVRGELVLVDGGRVALPGFESPGREEGLTLGGITATELKVAALERYRRTCARVGISTAPEGLQPAWFGRAAAFLAPLVCWALLCWSVDAVVAPWVPLSVVLGAVWRAARATRRG